VDLLHLIHKTVLIHPTQRQNTVMPTVVCQLSRLFTNRK